MSQKILCPTDLTAKSKHGVAYAFSLARRNGAQLIIFHSTSFPSLSQYPCYELEFYYEWEPIVSKLKLDNLLAEAELNVRKFVSGEFGTESKSVAWTPRVAVGKAADEIVVAALQEEVGLIVLARRQRTTLARIFARSISETVSRDAPCPVLSIYPAQVTRSQERRVAMIEAMIENS